MGALACPRCGGEKTERVAILYEQCTRVEESYGFGVGAGFDSGDAFISTSTVEQTALAAGMSPPARRYGHPGLFGLAVTLGLIGVGMLLIALDTEGPKPWVRGESDPRVARYLFAIAFLGGAIATGTIGILSCRNAGRYNRETLPKLHDEWLRRFMCLRCGTVWSIDG